MSTTMHTYDFIPSDTLFCRDQRPLQAGHSFGHGANWPLPTVLHSAIRTALLAANGGLPQRNSVDGHERRGVKRGKIASNKFSWLNLHGPFPVDEHDMTYFPIPRDIVPDGDEKKAALLRIIPNPGTNNLPKPLTHLAASFAKPSKDELPGWVSLEFYNLYLKANSGQLAAPSKAELWDDEYRIGVAIDPETQTAAESKLYAAEHLRVRDGVRLRFAISEDPHKKENANLTGFTLQLGGEQRFGKVEKTTCDLELPKTEVTGTLVKWVLLTPAIFLHGWRPGWIGDDGRVLLRVVDRTQRAKRRHERDHTESWRYDPTRYGDIEIKAKLVAAVVGKPQVIGGWDDAPKPTSLAVPSGSIYYFQAESDKDARHLVESLQHRCKSDFFGEKGLGLGVCGTWQHQTEPTSGNVPDTATNQKMN